MKPSNSSKVWSIPSNSSTHHIYSATVNPTEFLLTFLTTLILNYIWCQIHFSQFRHFHLFCDQCGSEENTARRVSDRAIKQQFLSAHITASALQLKKPLMSQAKIVFNGDDTLFCTYATRITRSWLNSSSTNILLRIPKFRHFLFKS